MLIKSIFIVLTFFLFRSYSDDLNPIIARQKSQFETISAARKDLFRYITRYEADFLLDALSYDPDFRVKNENVLRYVKPGSLTKDKLVEVLKRIDPYEALARLKLGVSKIPGQEHTKSDVGLNYGVFYSKNQELIKKMIPFKEQSDMIVEIVNNYEPKLVWKFLLNDDKIKNEFGSKIEESAKKAEEMLKNAPDLIRVQSMENLYANAVNEALKKKLNTPVRDLFRIPSYGPVRDLLATLMTGLQTVRDAERKNYLSYSHYLEQTKNSLEGLDRKNLLGEYKRFKDTYSSKTLIDMLLKDPKVFKLISTYHKDFFNDYLNSPEKLWGFLVSLHKESGGEPGAIDYKSLIAKLQTSERYPKGLKLDRKPETAAQRLELRTYRSFHKRYTRNATQEIEKKMLEYGVGSNEIFNKRAEEFVKSLEWNEVSDHLAMLDQNVSSNHMTDRFSSLEEEKNKAWGALYQKSIQGLIKPEKYQQEEKKLFRKFDDKKNKVISDARKTLLEKIKTNSQQFFAVIDGKEAGIEKTYEEIITRVKGFEGRPGVDLFQMVNDRVPLGIRYNTKSEELFQKLLAESGIAPKREVPIKPIREKADEIKLNSEELKKLAELNRLIGESNKKLSEVRQKLFSKRIEETKVIVHALGGNLVKNVESVIGVLKDQSFKDGVEAIKNVLKSSLPRVLEGLKSKPPSNISFETDYKTIEDANSQLNRMMAEIDRTTKELNESKIDNDFLKKPVGPIIEALSSMDGALKNVQESTDRERIVELQKKALEDLKRSTGIERVPIEETKTKFDPKFHQAVMMTPVSKQALNGIIMNVQREGYMDSNGRLIQEPMVIVGQFKPDKCAEVMSGMGQ